MALPTSLKRFNRDHLNPLTLKLTGHADLADLIHVGRTTGRQHHTPVMAFLDPLANHMIIALTYGPDVQWLKNVNKAGGCLLGRGRDRYRLGPPRRITAAQALPAIPQPQRSLLHWPIRCRDFIAFPILEKSSTDGSWAKARLISPTDEGFVLAAIASPRRRPFLNPLAGGSIRSGAALDDLAQEMGRQDNVLETVRLEAVLGAPGNPSPRATTSRSWDHALLVRTRTVEDAEYIAATADFHLSGTTSAPTLVTAARNVRRIDDVPHPTKGVYLLNFFTGPDVATTLDVWQHTAGWFQDETNLTNSTVLQPLTANTGYTVINHCRWERWGQVLPPLLAKRSFRGFVLRRFSEVDVQPHPILYKVRSVN